MALNIFQVSKKKAEQNQQKKKSIEQISSGEKNMNNNYKDRLTRSRAEDADVGECCDSPCIESKEGDNVCLNCGMIIGRNLVGNERRAYTVEEVNKLSLIHI